MIVVLLADGFTNDPQEQAKWRYYCQYFARNFVEYKPFDEFSDKVKIYRIDVVSAASGVTRSDSPDGRNMPGDPKSTYFSGLAIIHGYTIIKQADIFYHNRRESPDVRKAVYGQLLFTRLRRYLNLVYG